MIHDIKWTDQWYIAPWAIAMRLPTVKSFHRSLGSGLNSSTLNLHWENLFNISFANFHILKQSLHINIFWGQCIVKTSHHNKWMLHLVPNSWIMIYFIYLILFWISCNNILSVPWECPDSIVVCPLGQFRLTDSDQNCSGICHCQSTQQCVYINGTCPDGCESGWYGLSCEHKGKTSLSAVFVISDIIIISFSSSLHHWLTAKFCWLDRVCWFFLDNQLCKISWNDDSIYDHNEICTVLVN